MLSVISVAVRAEPHVAAPASDFLNSIGVNSAISRRGENLQKTIACARYTGIRWFRSGNESDIPMADLLALHQQAGVRFSWGLLSGGTDIGKLVTTAKPLAAAGALLAFEGPNEPNNWGVTYGGQAGGGSSPTWLPVALLQRDLYRAVKSDTVLRKYPVWSLSENGAEKDNVGLQFLTIPYRADCLLPGGTKFADSANVHNYIYHPNSPAVEDNKTWNAADPSSKAKVDGLYGEYGQTWGQHFPGYTEHELLTLPRVTTETGTTIGGDVTVKIHALNLLSMYLDQFKRGWSHTAVYLLRDRVDEAGNQKFGFYNPDYTPRLAAVYLHNLTTILADSGTKSRIGRLDYSIPAQPPTVHDLLLRKSDGTFELVLWGERVTGRSRINVVFGNRIPTVKMFDPTVGTAPFLGLRNVPNVSLELSDHPIVLEMSQL